MCISALDDLCLFVFIVPDAVDLLGTSRLLHVWVLLREGGERGLLEG